MASVVLATDGSEYARIAADRAMEAASERDATLHVLCVVDRRVHGEPGLSSNELSTIEAADRGHQFIDDVAADASATGLAVESAIEYGIPHEVVLEYAGTVDADLIVVGEHGDHDTHVGGVRRRIAERSEREVLVAAEPA